MPIPIITVTEEEYEQDLINIKSFLLLVQLKFDERTCTDRKRLGKVIRDLKTLQVRLQYLYTRNDSVEYMKIIELLEKKYYDEKI
jgi:hypothetical protein